MVEKALIDFSNAQNNKPKNSLLRKKRKSNKKKLKPYKKNKPYQIN